MALTNEKKGGVKSAKEVALSALFLAFLLGGQYAFSVLPAVEIVTVFTVAFAFCLGVSRCMIAVTAFAFLRQILFGFFPSVLILYLIYFNALALVFGSLGKGGNARKKWWIVVLCAGFCTAGFTLLDDLITPLYYGLEKGAWKSYFIASLPIMLTQTVWTVLAVGYLFLPLEKVFSTAAKKLKN